MDGHFISLFWFIRNECVYDTLKYELGCWSFIIGICKAEEDTVSFLSHFVKNLTPSSVIYVLLLTTFCRCDGDPSSTANTSIIALSLNRFNFWLLFWIYAGLNFHKRKQQFRLPKIKVLKKNDTLVIWLMTIQAPKT